MRAHVGEQGMDSKLSAISDKVDCATVPGALTSPDPEASTDHECPKVLDSYSS